MKMLPTSHARHTASRPRRPIPERTSAIPATTSTLWITGTERPALLASARAYWPNVRLADFAPRPAVGFFGWLSESLELRHGR